MSVCPLNRDIDIDIEERLNLELFWNVLVHEFYGFIALITLEQVNTTEKLKKKILLSKTAIVGTVVNFHCMQMGFVMRMRLIFGDDWNDVPCKSLFWSLAMM